MLCYGVKTKQKKIKGFKGKQNIEIDAKGTVKISNLLMRKANGDAFESV